MNDSTKMRLCVSEPKTDSLRLWVAGIGGLWEGGFPTAMGSTKEEAVGNMFLQASAFFQLGKHGLDQKTAADIGKAVLESPEQFGLYIDKQ